MKKLAKIIPLILVVVMALSTIGCGVPKGKPTLKDDKEMFIGAYCAPLPSDKTYKEAAECGITHIFAGGGDYYKYFGYNDPGYYEDPLYFGQKYGIDILFHVQDTSYSVMTKNEDYIKTQENFKGFLIWDEPVFNNFDYLAKDYQKFVQDYPDKSYFVNLLPLYAEGDQIPKGSYKQYLMEYYYKVFSKYDKNHKILMCDVYPLMTGEIYDKWLYNLELLRTTADKQNGDLYLYLQSQGFLGRWRQPTTRADLTYQMYVYLAYGVEGVAHYPYRTPESSGASNPAILDKNDKPTYMYDFAKYMNTLLHKLDGPYFNFDWKGVISSIGTQNIDGYNPNFDNAKNMIKEYGLLKEVKSTKDAIVGCFENSDGYQAFMAVNFTDPNFQERNTITLTFNKRCNKAIVYLEGEPKVMSVKDGQLKLTLKQGEGAFVIPYKEA